MPLVGAGLPEGAGGRVPFSSLGESDVYEQIEKSGQTVRPRGRREIGRSLRARGIGSGDFGARGDTRPNVEGGSVAFVGISTRFGPGSRGSGCYVQDFNRSAW